MNMADENIITTENKTPEVEVNQTPTIEELTQQLAEANANAMKWKNASDKQSSEIANMKKQIRSMQTAEQQKASDEAEAKIKHDEYVAGLEDYRQRNEAKERYLMQGMDVELAKSCADAEVDKDMDLLAMLQKQHTEAVVKQKEAEWNKRRPQPNFGTGNGVTVTQEQFNNMDYSERLNLKRNNPDLFRQLSKAEL